MRRSVEGYFTVEAAMVMPMILITILSVVYLLFFQYNRCLMEQDVGVLALRGAALQTEDNEDRIRRLREAAEDVYCEKYIVWESDEIQLKQEKGKLYVQQCGRLKIAGYDTWKATAIYENHVILPISFIRNYRRLMGG